MTNDKEQSSTQDNKTTANNSYHALVISSEVELTSFLMEILDFEYNDDISSESLKSDRSYNILFSLLEKIPKFTVIIEDKYVDRTYRDSYYIHFSCKHGEYSRFCKRLFIFSGDLFDKTENNLISRLNIAFLQKLLQDHFIGTIVIRPLRYGKIGRSLINPAYVLEKEDTYLRYAKYSASIYGTRLQVNAFPFSMQDGETTTCAETTIINLMDYFSRKYSEYKSILPSEIANIVGENDFERTLPSRGLRYSTISKVFSEVGFYPRLYRKNVFLDLSQFKRVMHYYIESGIAVALGTKVDEKTRHSFICMGHGKIDFDKLGKKIYAVYDSMHGNYIWIVDSADLCNNYITMNDGRVPYENLEWTVESKESPPKTSKPVKHMLGDYEPEMLMVPLYKRMFLEAQDAYDICTTALASKEVGIQLVNSKLGTKENPVIIRLFMCSSRNFKRQRITSFGSENTPVRAIYNNLRLPRFVWVCEIYDKEGYHNNKACGEIIVDATSSPEDAAKSILLYHYPKYILVCRNNVENTDKLFDQYEEFKVVETWEPFNGYDHNLFPPAKIKNNV